MLRAEFRLPSVISEDTAPDRKAPIRVKFEIPYFTVSGIQVILSRPCGENVPLHLLFQLLYEVLRVNVLSRFVISKSLKKVDIKLFHG